MNKVLNYRWSDLPRLAGVSLVYGLAISLMLAYLTTDGNISIMWIPSGIGLATLLIGGMKYWPAIFVGALTAYVWLGSSWLPSAFIAMSNVLEPLLGYWLLTRLRIKNSSFDLGLSHASDYLWMGAVAAITALLAAAIGVTTLWQAGVIGLFMLPKGLLHWWMGNMLGMVVFTPLILVWKKIPYPWLSPERVPETLACFSLAFLFGQIIFMGWFNESLGLIANGYWVFLFVAWAAIRFGRHGSLLIIGMTVLQTVLGAIQGVGLFTTTTDQTGLLGLWLYIMVLTIVGVILALTVYERRQAEQYEQFRSRTLEMLAGDEPLHLILEAIVRGVEHLNPTMRCSILLLDKEGKYFGSSIAPSLPDFYITAIEGSAVGMGAGSCEAAAYTGQRVIIDNIATHPYWTPYKELAASAGLGACWSEPIRLATGQVLGTVAIYHHEAHMPAEHDIAIIEQSARLASIAIERTQAQAALRQKERYQRALLDNFPFSVWLKDTESRFLSVNLEFARISGINNTDDLVGKDDFDIAPQEIAKGFRADDCGVLSSRQKKNVQEKIFTEGRHRWFETYKAPVIDDNGELLGTVGFARDITERKQAEKNLHLAASVFTHAREGIMITDADGIIIDINDAFTHINGYNRDEVLGRNPSFLGSGLQDQAFYVALWGDLLEKGHWSGEIWNRRKNGEVYAEIQTISAVRDTQGNTQHYVALFSDITSQKEHERQLEHIAHYDALTGLSNRVLLADRLRQAMTQAQRRSTRLAVAFLDLDGFKAVNDNHGHEVGDHLLITVATRMKLALREGDTLARLGGDEFVAVLLDQADIEDSEPMLSRLLTAAALPVAVGELVIQVSASLGVTFYPQAEDLDADQLLRQADQAMYQAKLAGKNRFHCFDLEHDQDVRSHHDSLKRIRRALLEQEFVLVYQPKVNMRTGTIIGVEALIRWQHPKKGLLLPAEFLPVIEDHPLAVDIGKWVIDTALTQVDLWHAAGLDLPVSVNIGARQLQQPDFVEHLRALLAEHPKVIPGDLELEVLETSTLQNVLGISQIIESCKEIGVYFALDDFGTGYASVTYLKHLSVTHIKIDQTFVQGMLDDPDDLAIVKGLLGLATAFHRQVIAEGVETVAHGTRLLQLGCDLGQGYGIAQPMSAQALSDWVTIWQPDPAWVNFTPLGGQWKNPQKCSF